MRRVEFIITTVSARAPVINCIFDVKLYAIVEHIVACGTLRIIITYDARDRVHVGECVARKTRLSCAYGRMHATYSKMLGFWYTVKPVLRKA